jgi:hypothetical protein
VGIVGAADEVGVPPHAEMIAPAMTLDTRIRLTEGFKAAVKRITGFRFSLM